MWRSAFAFALALGGPAAAPLVTTGEGGRPAVMPVRTPIPPVIDGVLDDAAWQGEPLPLGDWLTYNPLNGSRLDQVTEVRLAYDERALYVAFRCKDPDPGQVRGTMSRRDQIWNDDWVGLSLDSAGNGQSSYDLFVNPRGVQSDVLTTSSAGENSAPDWVWHSAGSRTPEGYDVELRLPLTMLRFESGDAVTMGLLFWRRVSRLGMSASWPEVKPGKSFLQSHAALVLRDLRQPLILELAPSATYAWNQVSTTPEGFDQADSRPDAGLSVRYGLTSSVALEGTFNPDFSQVESDAFQVEVNQRYPTFYSEKRPFFMEGMGTFELAGAGGDATMRAAVHTRTIVDPRWGGKVTGSRGRLTFAALAAGDEAPGRPDGSAASPLPGAEKVFLVGRSVYSLGRNSYAGALLTDTEFGDGYNRVAGSDVSLRFGSHALSATGLVTWSRDLETRADTRGAGGQVSYSYETRRFVFANQVEHYDRDFRMDTAFLNQTGITAGWSFAALSFYPDEKKHPWLKRVVPFVFARAGRDRVQAGDLRFVLPGLRMHLTRQGFFRVDTGFGREPWAGQEFDTRTTRVIAQGQLTRWLNLFTLYNFGRSVYYDDEAPFLGRSRSFTVEASFQPSARFNQSVAYQRVAFDRLEGEPVYRVDILNLRTTFQFDRHLFLRAILQYDSSRRQVLTDLLGSFEWAPGTVVYLGYGSLLEQREWDGADYLTGQGRYEIAKRGLFFKASYSHRF